MDIYGDALTSLLQCPVCLQLGTYRAHCLWEELVVHCGRILNDLYLLELPMDSETGNQHKHERSRTKWTASLDKIFADLTQPRPETIKVKYCPIYEQLCTIFTDTSADGKYAQSSHFEGLEKLVGNDAAGLSSNPVGGSSHPENPSSSRPVQGNCLTADKIVKNISEKKRKRPSETQPSSGQNKKDQEINEAMAEALLEMVAASRWRKAAPKQNNEKFTITNCIKALDEIGDIDQQLYFAALDLFEEPNLRETFISLKGNQIRLTWLQGKCGKSTIFL
ncbi:hypothetical protein GH714_016258 [Hevea brasiliensis]|uniref:Myb/SANT-like domain-containing protein n=1 Tax=Hevea brasiliensis TaxID=3981 RepID=A0A6A6NIL3_HEVBR|nr:hypothetical protein GH714_016258 [Hevea brasiliensis]